MQRVFICMMAAALMFGACIVSVDAQQATRRQGEERGSGKKPTRLYFSSAGWKSGKNKSWAQQRFKHVREYIRAHGDISQWKPVSLAWPLKSGSDKGHGPVVQLGDSPYALPELDDLLAMDFFLPGEIFEFEVPDTSPTTAAQNAYKLGRKYGTAFDNTNYDVIYIEVHSAAVHMGQGIVDEVADEDTYVQLVLLDAYVPNKELASFPLGKGADFAVHYRDVRTAMMLQGKLQQQLQGVAGPALPYCWNVDVSKYDTRNSVSWSEAHSYPTHFLFTSSGTGYGDDLLPINDRRPRHSEKHQARLRTVRKQMRSVPSKRPSKAALEKVLRELHEAVDNGNKDKAIDQFKAPDDERSAQRLRAGVLNLIRERELSQKGVAILLQESELREFKEVQPEKARKFAEHFGVSLESCYIMRHQRAEVIAYWNEDRFQLLRCEDIGRLGE